MVPVIGAVFQSNVTVQHVDARVGLHDASVGDMVQLVVSGEAESFCEPEVQITTAGQEHVKVRPDSSVAVVEIYSDGVAVRFGNIACAGSQLDIQFEKVSFYYWEMNVRIERKCFAKHIPLLKSMYDRLNPTEGRLK